MNPLAIDIDGCITPGKGKLANAAALYQLSQSIQTSNLKTHLCSGRSAPYIEAIAQVTGIADWAVCENGAYIYHPLSDEIHYNPALTEKTRTALLAFSQKLYQEPYRSLCRLELGKEICISLNPIGINIADLFEQLRQEIDTELLYINHSTTAVDITPKGVNKASGLQLLAQYQSYDVADFIGIGDTAGDLPFMELCGYTAAPANATEAVKSMVNYLSPYEDTEGVIDIFSRITAR